MSRQPSRSRATTSVGRSKNLRLGRPLRTCECTQALLDHLQLLLDDAPSVSKTVHNVRRRAFGKLRVRELPFNPGELAGVRVALLLESAPFGREIDQPFKRQSRDDVAC